MAKRRKIEEDSGHSAAWIVTFSDCMTLLLCFFVLLLSFSSFEEVSLSKFTGAFDCMTHNSIFPIKREILESMLPAIDKPIDRAEAGSEKPTVTAPHLKARPPEPPDVLDNDAFRDRRVFSIPSGKMFWGRGSQLTPAGQEHLTMLATFMRSVPCEVVVGYRTGGERSPDDEDIALHRAWAVIEWFITHERLGGERFIIAATSPAADRVREPVIEIALLAGSIAR